MGESIHGQYKGNGKISVELDRDDLRIITYCLCKQEQAILADEEAKDKYNKYTVDKLTTLAHIFDHLANCM